MTGRTFAASKTAKGKREKKKSTESILFLKKDKRSELSDLKQKRLLRNGRP